MKTAILVILTLFISAGYGQPTTYRNDLNAYYSKSSLKDPFFSLKVNEITLNADSTFEFWSRPNAS